MIDAAIVLQKYIRGWLTRYHFPDLLHEIWDVRCVRRYNWAAAKIQAGWKGMSVSIHTLYGIKTCRLHIFRQVRQEIDIKRILEKKLMASSDYPLITDMELSQSSMLELEPLTSTCALHPNNSNPSGGAQPRHEFGVKQRILQLMFNRHHLLSTKQQQGVLACNQYVFICRNVKWSILFIILF